MAPPVGTLRVGRYFLALLLIFVALYSVVSFGSRHTPKLGLDLVGGLRVIFTAQTPKGAPPPTSDQMTQSRQILEDRINTTGVTNATVVVQGSDQLVVEIPNGNKTDVASLGKAAILNFRGLTAPAVPVACKSRTAPGGSASTAPSGSGQTASGSPSASHSPGSREFRRLPSSSKSPGSSGARTMTPLNSGSAKPSGSVKPSGSTAAPTPSTSAPAQSQAVCNSDPFNTPIKLAGAGTAPFGGKALFDFDPSLKAKMPNAESCPAPGLADTKCKPYTALSAAQKQEISTALSSVDCGGVQNEPDDRESYYFACDDGKFFGTKVAYLLGFVVVQGQQIDSAAAQAPNGGNSQLQWTVALNLTSAGGNRWNAWTSKYNTQANASPLEGQAGACAAGSSTPCSDFVGFTLDGQVISAPITQAVLDQQTQISGNFDAASARNLAQELNYGKLPISFRLDANSNVSATLGSSQLRAAFLAGGIGLILVVIYSLLYYRGLGLVTIASLLVSGGLTYAMLVILGIQLGFTLDLAGIAGFIVALGITADSFVVFFERLKDEVHDGRSARVAVPRAWTRARRTILSADTVSFLAAAILYYFASAEVKGFAFTLGMSTILDLVVVFLFTHPLVALLSRSRAFGSKRFTGLDAVRGSGPVLDDTAADRAAERRPRRAGRVRSAVIDDTDTETDTETATESDIDTDTAADATTDDVVDETPVTDEHLADDTTDDPTPDEPPAPRRRTTPEPGSAAERAAARRARMRGKPTEDGEA